MHARAGSHATFVAVAGAGRTPRHFASIRLASIGGSRRVVLFIAKLNTADLVVLQELLEAGTVTPVVDRRYDLSKVPAALRYLGAGHAKGKMVIAHCGSSARTPTV
jgi:NADPH:quinone reductase-like Zn-dependent oxidoreductase